MSILFDTELYILNLVSILDSKYLVRGNTYNIDNSSFPAIRRGTDNQPAKKPRSDGSGNENASSGRDHLAYGCLLRNELLGAQIEELRGPPAPCSDGNRAALGSVQLPGTAQAFSPPVFRFRAQPHNAEVSFFLGYYTL
ncbi:unnamed protein product [Pieris macdunnoughi]|uniref:Uncharacterized protein n=1 Tax=Pieris macdunnoughi TaxID=345717 RepID=A0A821R737_9NEOP|nr:unnamed protein product [Pieris macdunnoughi]